MNLKISLFCAIIIVMLVPLIYALESNKGKLNNDLSDNGNTNRVKRWAGAGGNLRRKSPYSHTRRQKQQADKKSGSDKLDEHVLRAEADSLAAAAESVAAGNNAAAAAIEIEEGREAVKQDSKEKVQQTDAQTDYDNTNADSAQNYHENDESNEIQGEEIVHEKTKSSHMQHSSSGRNSNNNEDMHSDDESSGSDANAAEEALQTLKSQSSDLAHQIRMVFDLMARREAHLIEEMKKLQVILAQAISALNTEDDASNPNALFNRKRRANAGEEPYRACVYIESAEATGQHARVKRSAQQDTPEAQQSGIVYQRDSMTATGNNQNGAVGSELSNGFNGEASDGDFSDGIDLKAVYWLKLPPTEQMSEVKEKIQAMLDSIIKSGKDVLFIPIAKGFSSSRELTDEFMKTFRVRRSDFQRRRLKRTVQVLPMD